MANEELKKKAFEYRREVVPATYLGYPDVEIPMYSALDIDQAYIAGAKENQPNAEEMIKRLLKGGYITTGISDVKENLVFHNLIKNPNELPKNDNKILFFAKDTSCLENHYLNRYSIGYYDATNKLFVANSPGYSKDFAITEVLYWWELAE